VTTPVSTVTNQSGYDGSAAAEDNYEGAALNTVPSASYGEAGQNPSAVFGVGGMITIIWEASATGQSLHGGTMTMSPISL
jgi:hypothetical protein